MIFKKQYFVLKKGKLEIFFVLLNEKRAIWFLFTIEGYK